MKRISLISVLLLSSAGSARALNICTMTLNSSDERSVLKHAYAGPGNHFFELVPENKDPSWLKRACQSGVRCDVLLISGHFGGLFFGEKESQTLELSDLETHSCNQDCSGILNAKQVFLMGCNTLATKTPDHRSIDQYLHVLVNDGFPRSSAEEVVASRYENYGLSMAERMSLAFGNASRLYGFSSTGPVGAQNAPKLRAAFQRGSANFDENLTSEYMGTSFRIVKPSEELAPGSRKLSCDLRSANDSTRKQAFLAAFSSGDLALYFDQILNHANDSAFRSAVSSLPASVGPLLSLSAQVEAQASVLIGTQVKVMRLKEALGQITHEELLTALSDLIRNRIQTDLDYVALDQVCSIAKEDPELRFETSWLENSSSASLPYLLKLASCFHSLGASAVTQIKLISQTTSNEFARREALRAVNGTWSASEKNSLLNLTSRWSSRDRIEAQSSLGMIAGPGLASWESCSARAKQAHSAAARDNALWNCFHRSENSFPSLPACLAASYQFETASGLGAKWFCIQHFSNSLTLSACAQVAKKTSNPEKADDFIFHCWDALRAQHAVNRSECLGFTEVLKIPGNRIKQNWNCVNQIHD